jgi:ER lumen protein retaining receptor
MSAPAYNWLDPRWNVFRYLADISHLISLGFLLYKIISKRSAHGVSGKTQICYLVVFCTRYLNPNFINPPLYNIAFKVLFIASSALIVILMHTKYSQTYESRHDTFRIIFLFLISAALSAFSMPRRSPAVFAWTFSLWVEALAIIPQLFLLARTKGFDILCKQYIFFLSIYRVFYLLNWIYGFAKSRTKTPKVMWITGILQTVIYSDFIWRYFKAWVAGDEILPTRLSV